MAATNDHDISVLNDLISVTLDSARGYEESADDAKNPTFKLFTVSTQNDHARLAIDWAVALATGGITVEKGASLRMEVNGRSYQWPKEPLVVICCDGSEPAYMEVAMGAGLMPNLKAIIAKVVRKARLSRTEQWDVTAELIGHFADGLAAGRSTEQLTTEFGDQAAAARLIRRAKIRNRSRLWHAYRNVSRILGLFILGIVLFVITCGINVASDFIVKGVKKSNHKV